MFIGKSFMDYEKRKQVSDQVREVGVVEVNRVMLKEGEYGGWGVGGGWGGMMQAGGGGKKKLDNVQGLDIGIEDLSWRM